VVKYEDSKVGLPGLSSIFYYLELCDLEYITKFLSLHLSNVYIMYISTYLTGFCED